MNWLTTIRRWLRPEETIALVFLLPFIVVAWRQSYTFNWEYATMISYFAPGVLIGVVVWLANRSGRAAWRVVRDFLPFAFAIWVYENMHDVTTILHLPDRHQWLIAADEWLFRGHNPVVWMERWVSSPLSDVMALAYTSHFLLPPLLTALLYRRGRTAEFRDVVLAIVLTFFIGFIGYVLVPAISPVITMRERFHVDIEGAPVTKHALSLYTISSLKVPRDCFPSLHAAVGLVVLLSAWRVFRNFFWVALPVVLALLLSTVYLRFHYVVDVIAAVPLAVFTVWAAPRLNRWWFVKPGHVSAPAPAPPQAK